MSDNKTCETPLPNSFLQSGLLFVNKCTHTARSHAMEWTWLLLTLPLCQSDNQPSPIFRRYSRYYTYSPNKLWYDAKLPTTACWLRNPMRSQASLCLMIFSKWTNKWYRLFPSFTNLVGSHPLSASSLHPFWATRSTNCTISAMSAHCLFRTTERSEARWSSKAWSFSRSNGIAGMAEILFPWYV